jgi:pyruvate/2-oxoglutarate dehydrogenase complex dihydrolipoamide dehydrogenase (E3) component
MSSLERFQNVVLGGGEAGKYIAWELARWGQRVAVIERGLIGGSCPNIACLPRQRRYDDQATRDNRKNRPTGRFLSHRRAGAVGARHDAACQRRLVTSAKLVSGAELGRRRGVKFDIRHGEVPTRR